MQRGVFPLTMDAPRLAEEGDLQVLGDGEAQTLSSILMTAPYLRGPGSPVAKLAHLMNERVSILPSTTQPSLKLLGPTRGS
jgi:hypothetical protein